jgi:hypothetical protein
MRISAIFAAAALLSAGVAANAASFFVCTTGCAVTVSEGLGPNNGFNTTGGNPYTGSNTASATFTYTGSLDFDNSASQNSGPSGDLNSTFFNTGTISNYSGSGTVGTNPGHIGNVQVANYGNSSGNHTTSDLDFLGSSGSASNFDYGSYYTFNLGNLAAGTVLTITHDDGVSAYDNGSIFGTTTSGPTTAVTDTVTVGAAGDIVLRYGRENGTPSVFEVSAVTPSATPEPSSIALLGTGLLGFAGAVRRRMKR